MVSFQAKLLSLSRPFKQTKQKHGEKKEDDEDTIYGGPEPIGAVQEPSDLLLDHMKYTLATYDLNMTDKDSICCAVFYNCGWYTLSTESVILKEGYTFEDIMERIFALPETSELGINENPALASTMGIEGIYRHTTESLANNDSLPIDEMEPLAPCEDGNYEAFVLEIRLRTSSLFAQSLNDRG